MVRMRTVSAHNELNARKFRVCTACATLLASTLGTIYLLFFSIVIVKKKAKMLYKSAQVLSIPEEFTH